MTAPQNPDPAHQAIKTYYVGVRDGVRRFAWWKDGIEYVGSTGRTLKRALEMIACEEQAALEDGKIP